MVKDVRSMLKKIFICKLFRFISSHFGAIHLKCAPQPKTKKTQKPFILGFKVIQGCRRWHIKKLGTSVLWYLYVCAYLQLFSR